MASRDSVLNELRQVATTKKRLTRSDFTLTNGTSGERSEVAVWEAPSPVVLREAANIRLVVVTVEEFQTAGNGNQGTFNLSNDIISQNNTADLVLYSDGSLANEDSIDFSNNSFKYTDGGNQERLHAHYVCGDPGILEIEKVAPRSKGGISDVVYDDATTLLHNRDQNNEPPSFDFDRPEEKVVPRKWELRLFADISAHPVEWDDSSEDNSQSTTATNAILHLPIKVASRDVAGLSDVVKRDIIR